MRSLEMQAEGRPITAIALDIGYSTTSAFIELFKLTLGERLSSIDHAYI